MPTYFADEDDRRINVVFTYWISHANICGIKIGLVRDLIPTRNDKVEFSLDVVLRAVHSACDVPPQWSTMDHSNSVGNLFCLLKSEKRMLSPNFRLKPASSRVGDCGKRGCCCNLKRVKMLSRLPRSSKDLQHTDARHFVDEVVKGAHNQHKLSAQYV